jgi:hypothetical protein
MSSLDRTIIISSLLALSACSDYATFVTGTSIGITANANTEQAQIGYARAELFQGPAYADVGDAPQVVAFLGSDLAVFSPHVRQLYATGDAASLVTMPGAPQACPNDGKPPTNGQPTLCAEKAEDWAGERRPMVFGTGSSVGLNLGFTGNAPSSIKFGYDREELSIIPFHAQPPKAGSKQPDKYSSVLASLNLNVAAPSLLGSGLKITQFFATGAAARNLAKQYQIRSYFADTAAKAVSVVGSYEPDNNSKCIRDWRGSPADSTKVKLINDKSKSLGADMGSFLDDPQFATDRASFVNDNLIKCV